MLELGEAVLLIDKCGGGGRGQKLKWPLYIHLQKIVFSCNYFFFPII